MRAAISSAAEASAAGMRCVVIASRYHGDIVGRLLDGALNALATRGAERSHQTIVWAPGALEIPLMAQAVLSAAGRERPHAVICLGCVIKGGTDHYEHVCRATVDGVMRVALDARAIVTNGVLTVATLEQANERAGGAVGNKGEEAAIAAIETWAALQTFGSV